MTEEAKGVQLMREHELACERESSAAKPELIAVLRASVDCILETVHALDGLADLEPADQAVLTELILGARAARVYLSHTLTGHYESAMAIARTLIEDGIACAFLAEHPEVAAKWIDGMVDPKYGTMAAAVIEAHAQREEPTAPAEAAAWRRSGEALRQMRQVLDDMSHANPSRFPFVRTARGYQLYPFFDVDMLHLVAWYGLLGLFQMLFFGRVTLAHHGRPAPPCNTEELRDRMVRALDALQPSGAPTDQPSTPAAASTSPLDPDQGDDASPAAVRLRRFPDAPGSDTAFWDRRGRDQMAQPATWVLKAQQLRRAAETLWQEINRSDPHRETGGDAAVRRMFNRHSMRPVYMMLAGFALENVTKALIVTGQSETIRQTGRLPWLKNGHALSRLFQDAGVELDEVEKDLARRLEIFIRWSGRYPVSAKPEDFRSEWLQDDPTEPGTYMKATGQDDHAIFLKLFERLSGVNADA